MVKIKYIGELSRVILGKRMFKDDIRIVNDKLVSLLRGIDDVVILGEPEKVQEVPTETTEEKVEVVTLAPFGMEQPKPQRKGKSQKAHIQKPAQPKQKRSKK